MGARRYWRSTDDASGEPKQRPRECQDRPYLIGPRLSNGVIMVRSARTRSVIKELSPIPSFLLDVRLVNELDEF